MSEFVFIPLCFIVFLAVILLIYNNNVVVKKYKLKSDKIKTPLKIVLLTDFHNKHSKKYLKKVLLKTRAQNPDMIVVAGDAVDRRNPDFETTREFLQGVSQIAKTYYITGNHERALGKTHCIENLGCKDMLFDEKYEIYDDYSLLGLSDTVGLSDFSSQIDLVSIFSRLETYKIVFVHRPIEFYDHLKLSEQDVDLVLCGHTHGGLIRIPFFGAVISPDEGFFPQYTRGVYHKNNTAMIVSGGLGNTLLPLRINNFPQIVAVEINN